MSASQVLGKKRKRHSDRSEMVKKPEEIAISQNEPSVSQLEQRIQESQKNYNDIAALLNISKKEISDDKNEMPATLAVCRVFCRLFADGTLSKQNDMTDKERLVLDWLKERLAEYLRLLLKLVQSSDATKQSLPVTLSMQMVKAEGLRLSKSSIFPVLLLGVLRTVNASKSYEEIRQYAQNYDDIRHYLFMQVTTLIKSSVNKETTTGEAKTIISNSLMILSNLDAPEDKVTKLKTMFCDNMEREKLEVISMPQHKKAAQTVWLTLLASGLERNQRKWILRIVTEQIVPWFQNVELLMDFLTDSYNEGGATSLLALSGLFRLMQEKNLDYPDFFKKLYSLLDTSLLHSKHRSRFFRLMNTFLASTHLPAALVASFIKRLSRLALHGPPAGVVAVIPWVYNMLKSHPTCTFMIHREPRTVEERKEMEELGADDTFDMNEPDPMQTGAIDSCLWELETLQSHYHPNVASLARIISEQFTKSSYNLDDFLDHSYSSLIDAELDRDLKKTPVVEYEIPKRIFVQKDGDDTLQKLMENVLKST